MAAYTRGRKCGNLRCEEQRNGENGAGHLLEASHGLTGVVRE